MTGSGAGAEFGGVKTVDVLRPGAQPADAMAACHAIRRVVFIEGQSVPESIEVDGRDPACAHFLLRVDGEPVATARLRVADGHAKAERVAVLASWRGHGYGHDVMAALETYAAAEGHSEVILGAQIQVVSFYEARGYEAYGDEYMEAGIRHRMMKKALSS